MQCKNSDIIKRQYKIFFPEPTNIFLHIFLNNNGIHSLSIVHYFNFRKNPDKQQVYFVSPRTQNASWDIRCVNKVIKCNNNKKQSGLFALTWLKNYNTYLKYGISNTFIKHGSLSSY